LGATPDPNRSPPIWSALGSFCIHGAHDVAKSISGLSHSRTNSSMNCISAITFGLRSHKLVSLKSGAYESDLAPEPMYCMKLL